MITLPSSGRGIRQADKVKFEGGKAAFESVLKAWVTGIQEVVKGDHEQCLLLRPALSEPLRPELFRGETRRMSHAVAGRIFPGCSVGQGAYGARGSLGGKRQGSSGS